MAPCLKISPPSPSALTAFAISYPYISRPARASTASRTSDESPAISSLRNLRVKEDSVVTTRLLSASLAITKFYLARTSYYAIVHYMRNSRIYGSHHNQLIFLRSAHVGAGKVARERKRQPANCDRYDSREGEF